MDFLEGGVEKIRRSLAAVVLGAGCLNPLFAGGLVMPLCRDEAELLCNNGEAVVFFAPEYGGGVSGFGLFDEGVASGEAVDMVGEGAVTVG